MGWKETRFVLVEVGGERAIQAGARGKPLRLRRLDENNRYQKMILKEGNLFGCHNLRFDNHPQDFVNPASRSRDVLRVKPMRTEKIVPASTMNGYILYWRKRSATAGKISPVALLT